MLKEDGWWSLKVVGLPATMRRDVCQARRFDEGETVALGSDDDILRASLPFGSRIADGVGEVGGVCRCALRAVIVAEGCGQ